MNFLVNIYVQLTSVNYHKGCGPSEPKINPSGASKTTQNG